MAGRGENTGYLAAARWLFLPWWALQVFSGAKSFYANPILGSLRLNRRGFSVWRARLAHRVARSRRRRLEHMVAPADRLAFERDGFVVKPDFLAPELFKALLGELADLTATAGEFKEGDAITRRIPLTPETLRRLPACGRLLRHPQFQGLTRYVSSFDSEPLVFVQTIFSRVDASQRDPQTSMHMDTFHPTMKAWLFLHDVAEEDGPLTYTPGSHRRTLRREAWERREIIRVCDPATPKKGGAFRIDTPDMARLRCAKPRRFAAPANTLVVGDTYGFHARRRSTRPSVRVEIWAYSRRNPFAPWTRLGFGGVKGWEGRVAELGWRLMELRGKLGLAIPQFRRVAAVGPATPPEPWA